MKNNKILLYLMILISVMLCIPSIIYLIINGTVDGFDGFLTYTLVKSENNTIMLISGVLIIGLFLLFSILYLLIIKKEKEIFKSEKQVMIFIIIISLIFMMILPYLSSDIFYYIGDSWLCSKYHENPYYTTVKDLQDRGINDEILNNTGGWKNTVTVYGTLYNMISIGLTCISFGNVTLALFIFKIVSLCIHIFNCFIMKKLTKSKKYMLLYGLNPLILIELLSNVHNDIYLILFLLLSLYYLIRKKNIPLTVLFLAFSVAIKFNTILTVPFIFIYCFRKENLIKRIIYCILCGIATLTIILLLYMPFYRDLSIFTNMLAQGERYSQSILACLKVKFNRNNIFNYIDKSKLLVFAIGYIFTLIKMLFTRKISFKYIIRKYNILMLIFIFLCLVNFQKWYVLWVFPTIMWQSKHMRYYIINLTLTGIMPSFNYFRTQTDYFKEGMYYSSIVIILSLLLVLINVIYSKIYKMISKKQFKKNKNIRNCINDEC